MTKPAGQRAVAGDSIRDVVTASAWNSMLDMLDSWRRSAGGFNVTPGEVTSGDCVIEVKNDTGADLSRWACVGLGDVTVAPSENTDEFVERHVVTATTPASTHATKFAILQEAIPDGEIGRAVVCGKTIATVDVASAGDSYAAPAVGSPVLRSAASGPVRIVYAETTGETQALVVIGGGGNSTTRDDNPCCGCPPTQCYDQYETVTPPLLSVDFGDMLCCDGRAGGVKTLRWNGSAWVSPTFWCQPDAGGSGDCGTAVFTWSDTGETCVTNAQYVWTPGTPGSPNNCTNGSWAISVVCGEGCGPDESFLPEWPSNPCNATTVEVPCNATGGGSWSLTTNECSCDEAPVAPARDGTFDGEQVTVFCLGTPDTPPADVPCTGDSMDEVLWSGDTLADAGDLLYLPGTVLWAWQAMQGGHGWGYSLSWNGCDPLESAHATVPSWTWSPGDLCPGENTPPTGVPKYVIKACASEPCPPEGYVAARWVLVPPVGYDPARLELRVGGVVKVRYVMPANRTFCQACLNKMEIEQTGCTWPCANIPEFVCVRPYGGSGGTCLPYGTAYTMSVPTMTVSNPAIGAITAGQLSEAAGDYALDLIDNNGWDPRYEDNGCRTSDPTCCTWLAPRSDLVTSEIFCDHTGWLGWVLQTCDPQSRHGLNAKRLENYDCSGEATPVLRFGIYIYEQFEPGLVGPALIRWTAFRGPAYGDTLSMTPPSAPVCCGPGSCGVNSACTSDSGYYDPTLVYAYGYWLTWTLKEILTDGTLVMRMSDADYTGWVTAFPQEIELSPA